MHDSDLTRIQLGRSGDPSRAHVSYTPATATRDSPRDKRQGVGRWEGTCRREWKIDAFVWGHEKFNITIPTAGDTRAYEDAVRGDALISMHKRKDSVESCLSLSLSGVLAKRQCSCEWLFVRVRVSVHVHTCVCRRNDAPYSAIWTICFYSSRGYRISTRRRAIRAVCTPVIVHARLHHRIYITMGVLTVGGRTCRPAAMNSSSSAFETHR